MKIAAIKKLLVTLSLFACSPLFAAPLEVNLTGIKSIGEYGHFDNEVILLDVGANARITGFSFDFLLIAFEPSQLSDVSIRYENREQTEGASFTPGQGLSFPGALSYVGFIDLVAMGKDFKVGADGILRLEFFEIQDHVEGVDAEWQLGTIAFNVEPALGEVPEPATALLVGAGLALLGYTSRRRRSNAAGKAIA